MTVREPVVAGRFYPASPSSLEKEIEGYVDEAAPKEDVIGLISPHAGYMYSGPVAGAVISRIRFRDTFVVMGPSHTGYGKPFSIMTEGTWRTPLGNVEIDSVLGRHILSRSGHLDEDEVAHLYEHSIEVQLPFLQYFRRDVRIVPIVLAPASSDVYKEIGKEVARAIRETKAEAVILASTDMTHYESHESAGRKDHSAIDAIVELDEDGLMQRVKDMRISMCGYAPTVALIAAAKELGARRAELVRYQTSGDVSGDFGSVVGYAGIIIARGREAEHEA